MITKTKLTITMRFFAGAIRKRRIVAFCDGTLAETQRVVDEVFADKARYLQVGHEGGQITIRASDIESIHLKDVSG